MSRGHEIVEVTLTRHRKGERVLIGFADDYDIQRPHTEDWDDLKFFDHIGEPLPTNDPSKADFGLVFISTPEDWHGLKFRCVGESFDAVLAGGIEADIQAVGAPDVFDRDVDKLIRMGDELLDSDSGRVNWRKNQDTRSVKFLTLWAYQVSTDYEGEIDVDYWLLGRLDANRMKELVINESVNAAGGDDDRSTN